MGKYTMGDLKLLSNLSQILTVSASKNIEIEKHQTGDKCTYLGIKDADSDKILLGIEKSDDNKISGVYSNWVTGEKHNYIIKRLFRNIFILELGDDEFNKQQLLLQCNSRYNDPIKTCISYGMTEIQLSSIADLQILTKEEESQGIQLVKQMKPTKTKNS